MSQRRVLGVDFGSSQSFVSELLIGTSDCPELLRLGTADKEIVPTVLACDQDDDTLIAAGGEVYDRRRRKDHDRFYVVRDFKRYLNEKMPSDDDSFVSERHANAFCSLFLSYLNQLIREKKNLNELSSEDWDTCFAYPATWEGTEKTKVLKQLATEAGFPNVHTIAEPIAAVYALKAESGLRFADKPEKYMVIDFGGGTLDICVIQLDTLGRDPAILSTSGDSKLGGKEFDLIFKRVYERCCDLRYRDFSEPQKAEFDEECKRAKELCSLNFASPDNNTYTHTFKIRRDVQVSITKYELENICEEMGIFRRIDTSIKDALEKAGVEYADIQKVVLTGGSSQWYFMRERVAKLFGIVGEDIYLTKKPCEDVSKGCSICYGHSAQPPVKDGVWVKYRTIIKRKFPWQKDVVSEWSSLKRLMSPSYQGHETVPDRVFISQFNETNSFEPYLVQFKLYSAKSEEECDESAFFRCELEVYANTNTPTWDRLLGIWHVISNGEHKKVPDDYNLYLQCIPTHVGNEFVYELHDALTIAENKNPNSTSHPGGTIKRGKLVPGCRTHPTAWGFGPVVTSEIR